MARSSRLFVVVMLAAVVGCGGSGGFPKTYPVTGTVKLNGKPIDGAMVTFQIEDGKQNAIGTTDKNGEFSLSMFRPGDGSAIPGTYRVSIKKENASAPTPNAPPPGQLGAAELSADYAPPVEAKATGGGKKKSEVPDKYTNDQTSGLRATVTESKSDNKFDFELK